MEVFSLIIRQVWKRAAAPLLIIRPRHRGRLRAGLAAPPDPPVHTGFRSPGSIPHDVLHHPEPGFHRSAVPGWKSDPAAVTAGLALLLRGLRAGGRPAGGRFGAGRRRSRRCAQARVHALVHRFREIGHLLACLDPLEACPIEHPLLSLESVGLALEDLDRRSSSSPTGRRTSRRRCGTSWPGFRETYSRSIGVEFMHLQDPAERRWLIDRMEPVRNAPAARRGRAAPHPGKAHPQRRVFEQFLNTKYVGVTRFSLGGRGRPHPGPGLSSCERAAALGLPRDHPRHGPPRPAQRPGQHPRQALQRHLQRVRELLRPGDARRRRRRQVPQRLPRATCGPRTGRELRMLLMNNPSHLEAVDPVVEGFARARQEPLGAGAASGCCRC
ncbi:MAG: hypothetical protein MZV70_71640 [Desulfobacterales bacterium]|nr:hypothetical protein [Desulfobacterales bacterium]